MVTLFAGVEALVYYTPEVMAALGVTGRGLLLATMVVGAVKVGYLDC